MGWILRRRGFCGWRRRRWSVRRRCAGLTFSKLTIYGYLEPGPIEPAAGERSVIANIEVLWLLPDFETGLQDRIADFRRATIAPRFAPCSASSYCCADASTCTAASCWRSTEPASMRSTTRLATSPALRCESSSAAPTKWLEDYLKRLDEGDVEDGRDRGQGAHQEPGRKRFCAQRRSAAVTKRCWPVPARPNRRGPDLAEQIPTVAPWPRIRRSASATNVQVAVEREEQADRRTGGDKPGRGHGPADGNFRSRPAKSWGSRRSTASALRIAATSRPKTSKALRARPAAFPTLPKPRVVGARGPVSQGRVPIRWRARCLRLPRREVADANPPRPDARSRKDRLRQPESLPRLPAAPAMHERRPLRFPPRKRGRSRSHGEPPSKRGRRFSTAAARSSSTRISAASSSGCSSRALS